MYLLCEIYSASELYERTQKRAKIAIVLTIEVNLGLLLLTNAFMNYIGIFYTQLLLLRLLVMIKL